MKPETLTRSADFRRAYDEGRRARRNGVAVVARDRADGHPARVGYAVKKGAGGAVVRNRIKRRLRVIVRSLELRPGCDVVVSGEAAVASLDFQVLSTHVSSAVDAAGAAR